MRITSGELRRIIREAAGRPERPTTLTLGQLRELVQEEHAYTQALAETGSEADFGSVLDTILQDLYNTNKKVEKAHQLAPGGTAKAIVAGIHSDLFNKVSEFRKYVQQLKQLANKQTHAEARRRSKKRG